MLFITSAVHNKTRQTEFLKIVQFILVKIKQYEVIKIVCNTNNLYLKTIQLSVIKQCTVNIIHFLQSDFTCYLLTLVLYKIWVREKNSRYRNKNPKNGVAKQNLNMTVQWIHLD